MVPTYVALVAVLAIMQVIVFSLLVGRGRLKYGVAAPATSGHPTWDRLHRVHLNSVENAVLFLPLVLLFSIFVSAVGAALLGLAYIVARTMYAVGYVRDPEGRFLGSVLTVMVQLVLAVGTLGGILARMARA